MPYPKLYGRGIGCEAVVLPAATNNEAEVTALLEGVKLVHRLKATQIFIDRDSLLAISCLNRKCHIGWRMRRAIYGTWELLRGKTWAANHVYREGNGAADELAVHVMRKTIGDNPTIISRFIVEDTVGVTRYRLN
ncbi:hypothetical protein AMTR_s00142p00111340 [Amborella trichopoda]|uniref:RNase H type-1 domain-containing protein n=1 Tax=Amborella trichopoda TaxID=13333 RepID=W1P868_AMBTC|nr:hypothetical protein AMTR_s00142p00111340 [Amborella trichopoda]